MENNPSQKTAHAKPDAARSAKVFGVTIEQAQRLMARNAAGLAQMADKAKRTGKKCNGYTEAELRASAAEYAQASKA